MDAFYEPYINGEKELRKSMRNTGAIPAPSGGNMRVPEIETSTEAERRQYIKMLFHVLQTARCADFARYFGKDPNLPMQIISVESEAI